MALKPKELVRLYIGDQLPDEGDDTNAQFADTEVEALLERYGNSPERVAGILMDCVANDKARASRRAQTLNITIEEAVTGAAVQAERWLARAEQVETGQFSQCRPVVTQQGRTGRPIFHKKGIAGVGEGEVSDADARATSEPKMVPE